MGKDAIKYLDKDKEFIKTTIEEVAEDLHAITNLCMCFEKDGVFNFITQDGVTDYDLIKLKSHLEEYITFRMIKANFITPEDYEK